MTDLSQAACIGDGEMWFSKDIRDIALAKAICKNDCPVRTACLEQTLHVEGQEGGGVSFQWTREAGAITSRCVLCGLANRSLSESAIYLSQRGHDAMTCQRRRAEAARVAEAPVDDDVETCPEGHERAGNTHVDKNGCLVCNACRREKYAATPTRAGGELMAETCCQIRGFVIYGWYDNGAKTNRPTRERRTVLSTPSSYNERKVPDGNCT